VKTRKHYDMIYTSTIIIILSSNIKFSLGNSVTHNPYVIHSVMTSDSCEVTRYTFREHTRNFEPRAKLFV